MTQINKGQSRAKEVHARNEQRYLQKHGHPRPGNGNKSDKTTNPQETLNNTNLISSDGMNSKEISNTLPTSSSSGIQTNNTSQNIARAKTTGGPNDTVAYLEGAIDDALDPQRLYKETYVA